MDWWPSLTMWRAERRESSLELVTTVMYSHYCDSPTSVAMSTLVGSN